MKRNIFLISVVISLGVCTFYFALEHIQYIQQNEVQFSIKSKILFQGSDISGKRIQGILGNRYLPVHNRANRNIFNGKKNYLNNNKKDSRIDERDMIIFSKNENIEEKEGGFDYLEEEEELTKKKTIHNKINDKNYIKPNFLEISTIYGYYKRNENYMPAEITRERLKKEKIGTLSFFRVLTSDLPVLNRVVQTVKLPVSKSSSSNNNSSFIENYVKNYSSRSLNNSRTLRVVRMLKMGQYILGVDVFRGKTPNSMWVRTSKSEYVPFFTRVQGIKGVVVHLEQESKIPGYVLLNEKPFESRSRDCTWIREFPIRTACLRFAHAIKESRRLLRDYNLLNILSTNTSLIPNPINNNDFNENLSRLFSPMSNIEICASSEWTRCTLHEFCTWTYSIERKTSYCIHVSTQPVSKLQGKFDKLEYDTYNKTLDFNLNEINQDKKYFVYQPSGGMNNQRIQLEMALTICLIIKRTCVLPHMAQHTNYYFRYNMHPASRTTSMQRIFDMQKVLEIVDVVTLPENLTLIQWIESVGGLPYISQGTGLNTDTKDTNGWRVIMRDSRKMISKYIWKDAHIRRFSSDNSRFLFFANHTMWGTIDLYPWSKYYKLARNAIQFTRPTKLLAIKIANKLGKYNSLHIRRGDKKKEVGFLQVVRDADVYAKRMLPYIDETPSKTLYISTDEKDLKYLMPIADRGFNITTAYDLDQNLLNDYILRFPPQMYRDILGMIEQLICAYSLKFLGSSYSTFTMYILRLRRFYPTLAIYNSTISDYPLLEMNMTHQPLIYKDVNLEKYKSLCDPFRPENHRSPC